MSRLDNNSKSRVISIYDGMMIFLVLLGSGEASAFPGKGMRCANNFSVISED